MGDAQMRVTFDFSGAWEIHYISEVPEVGDLVSHRRELWVVRAVEFEEVGVLVSCVLPEASRAGSA
jgi:hypothetical protein